MILKPILSTVSRKCMENSMESFSVDIGLNELTNLIGATLKS